MDGDKEVMNKMLTTVGLTLTNEEKDQQGKELLKTVMSKWLSAADTILEMCVLHLPSPRAAQ
jgi:elongation factor 2